MVNSSTLLSDTVKFIRDDLASNITDPIASSRVGRERFVMTSYPKRPVKYPVITVIGTMQDANSLGMGSESMKVALRLEIRIWARNVKEKDELTEQVFNQLRTNQLGANSSTSAYLYGFEQVGVTDIDEEGDDQPKSKIMIIKYFFIAS
jgi:hypothetical protein